jgi:glucose/arabinose dehydrogenase
MITPGDANQPTKVEPLPVKLSGAQGLLWAFDSLYAVVNGPGSGLHRLRDTDGDGLVDSDEFCMPLQGAGEHGPHAVILSPDKKSLFVVGGNHTKLPTTIAGSRIPQNWNEDHLLPRRWDANGHAAGILAPGGWICNVDPTGKDWTVYSMGYRNQYDIAFNSDGDLFTYDADMEWDFGSPWYRPTRVCHATSGSEFGWRSGTGKWPTYYEDSLPPAVEIGPGSPTGVLFGTGAKFPAAYQNALYILDWTYSTIYSVELTPDGSSYTGKKSDFVTGSPLPVTDAVPFTLRQVDEARNLLCIA